MSEFTPLKSGYVPLPGFMPTKELEELVALAAGKVVLEVGCWKGRTAHAMAQTAKHVVTIDHYRGDSYAGPAFTLPETWHNLRKQSNIVMIAGSFEKVLPTLNLRAFDILFYDGDHNYAPTKLFFDLVLPRCRPDAVLVIDDHNDKYPQVIEAVAEAVSLRNFRLCGSLAILEPI